MPAATFVVFAGAAAVFVCATGAVTVTCDGVVLAPSVTTVVLLTGVVVLLLLLAPATLPVVPVVVVVVVPAVPVVVPAAPVVVVVETPMPAQPCAPVDGVTMRNSLIGVPPRNAVSMFCAVTSTHEFGFGGVSDSVTTTPAWPRRFVVSVQPCTSQPPRPWPIVLKPPKFTESGSILPSGLRLKCTVAPETGFPKKSRTVSTQTFVRALRDTVQRLRGLGLDGLRQRVRGGPRRVERLLVG